MQTVVHNLRYGFRMLAKSPGFTAVAVLTLALGIGANTTVFSVVNAVLLKVLPYPHPERLVAMVESEKVTGEVSVSWPDFIDWQKQNQVFQSIAVYRYNGANLTGADQPVRLRVIEVSASFFAITGAMPVAGRTFTAEEDRHGASPTVVLTHRLWADRFGSDPNVVGKALKLDGAEYTVVGVLPADYWVPHPVDLVTPIGLHTNDAGWLDRGNHNGLRAVALLKGSISREQAQADMSAIASRLEQEYPRSNSGETVRIVPLNQRIAGEFSRMLYMLLAAVGFVLLTACANVASLMLARASARQKEMAVRAALGAGRVRLMLQALTESLILSLAGGGLGVLVAVYAIDPKINPLLRTAARDIPRLENIHLDLVVLGFVLAVSVLTGLIFGVMPAWQMSRPDLMETLKQATRSSTAGRSRTRLRSAVLVAEVALALVTAAGAGLMIRSMIRVEESSVGFEPQHLLALGINLPTSKYPKAEQALRFFDQALQRVATVPGVRSAVGVRCLPMAGGCWDSVYLPLDRPAPAQLDLPDADFNVVSADYFKTLGIPIIKGRTLTEKDDAKSPLVALINQTMARQMWPHGDPLGKRIEQGFPQDKMPALEIVGVVGDVKRESLAAEQRPEIFLPLAQNSAAWAISALVVRTAQDPMSVAGDVERAIHEIDKDQPLTDIQPMTQYMADSIAGRRVSTLLLSVFAGIALGLAGIGIYGVMAYNVSLRMQEMGIRIALGAQTHDLFRLVVGQGLTLALAGVAAGLVLSLATTRYMTSLLLGVAPTDPATFMAVSFLLTTLASLASYFPARRATKADPVVALRYE
jgi:putative ABC transport system permease protein